MRPGQGQKKIKGGFAFNLGAWEYTFEETVVVAVHIHMLRRQRDFQLNPRAMPPGVNIKMRQRNST